MSEDHDAWALELLRERPDTPERSIEPGEGSGRKSWWSSRQNRLWNMTGGRCAYCGAPFTSMREMTADHLVPRSKGGSNAASNLYPCCRSCNAIKGPRPVEYLRDAMQRLISGRPQFSERQRRWLTEQGISLPAEERFVFYWEEMGNSLPQESP